MLIVRGTFATVKNNYLSPNKQADAKLAENIYQLEAKWQKFHVLCMKEQKPCHSVDAWLLTGELTV